MRAFAQCGPIDLLRDRCAKKDGAARSRNEDVGLRGSKLALNSMKVCHRCELDHALAGQGYPQFQLTASRFDKTPQRG